MLNTIQTKDSFDFKDVKEVGDDNYTDIIFSWYVTNRCQYKCSYCSSYAINRESESNFKNYKLVLKRLSLIKFNFRIDIIGGEPTLHPNLIEILESLHSNEYCNDIYLFSNIKDIDKLKMLKKLNLNKIILIASFHQEYNNIDNFIEKIKQIDLKLIVNVNITDDSIFELLDKLIINDIDYSINPLEDHDNYTHINKHDVNRLEKYLNTQQTIIYKAKNNFEFTPYEIKLNKLNRFKGWKCSPIMYEINSNGDIVNECTDKVLPFIPTKKDLYDKIICEQDCCECTAMYNIKKEFHE